MYYCLLLLSLNFELYKIYSVKWVGWLKLQDSYQRSCECHVGTKPAMASGMLRGAKSIVNSPMPLNMYKYKRYVSTLKDSDALTAEEFKQSNWANYFVLDTLFTFQNGKANPNHLFDFFANLSQNIAMDVRVALLQNVADEVDFYMTRNTICLEQHSTSFETWVEKMGDEKVFCD